MSTQVTTTTTQRVPQTSIDIEDGDNIQGISSTDRSTSKVLYFIGVVYVLCASAALSFQSCWVKFGKKEKFEPFQMLLGRGIVQLFFTALIDVYDNCLCTNDKDNKSLNNVNSGKPKNLPPQNRKDWMWIAIRGILGFLTAYGNYYALTLLPLGMI